jgi:hypothetical protein
MRSLSQTSGFSLGGAVVETTTRDAVFRWPFRTTVTIKGRWDSGW